MFKNERIKAVSFSYLISTLSRFSGLCLTLFTTPWLFEYLGKEGFGLWGIFIQFFAFATFSDFGLSNGLHNTLLRYRYEREHHENRLLVQKTIVLMTLISLILMAVSLLGAQFLDLRSLFDVGDAKFNGSLYLCLALVIVIFYINVPLAVMQKVEFALMDHQRVYAWQVLSRVMYIGFIYLGIFWEFNLAALLAAFFIPLVVTNLANTLTYKKMDITKFDKRMIQLNDSDVKNIWHKGMLFFALGIFFALGRSTDQFVIGSLGSLSAVADYQIVSRLFDVPLLSITMFTAIMWSAFSEAIQNREYKWVSNTLAKITLVIVCLMSVAAVVFFWYGNAVLSFWLGRSVNIDQDFFCVMAAWASCVAFYNLLASYLNARDYIAFQVVTFAVYFLIGFPLKLWVLPRFGLSAFIWVGVIVFLCVLILPSFLLIRRDMKALRLSVNKR